MYTKYARKRMCDLNNVQFIFISCKYVLDILSYDECQMILKAHTPSATQSNKKQSLKKPLSEWF